MPITILLITGNATSENARLKSDEMKVSRLREVDWLLQKEQLDQDDNGHGQLTLHIFIAIFFDAFV